MITIRPSFAIRSRVGIYMSRAGNGLHVGLRTGPAAEEPMNPSVVVIAEKVLLGHVDDALPVLICIPVHLSGASAIPGDFRRRSVFVLDAPSPSMQHPLVQARPRVRSIRRPRIRLPSARSPLCSYSLVSHGRIPRTTPAVSSESLLST